MSKTTKKWMIISAIALAIITIDVLWNGWAVIGRFDHTLRAGFWFVAAVVLPTIVGLLIDRRRWKGEDRLKERAYAERVKEWEDRGSGGYSKPQEPRPTSLGDWAEDHLLSMASVWLAGIAIIGAIIWGVAVQGYLVNSNYVAQMGTTDAVPTFRDRAPWVLADTYASRDQGDDVGDRGQVKHVPVPSDAKASRYTTLITGRDVLGNVGYKAVRVYNLPKVGPIVSNAVTKSCEFPESMPKRWDAPWPNRSLNRDIAFANPLLHFNSSDRYAYCDANNSPVVVQPLWKYDGLFVVTKVPAGVAVYDAKGFSIYSPGEAMDTEAVDGPIFPMSLAATYREALPAMGSWGDYISKRGGYDATDKDKSDTNAGNTTELGLVDGTGEYTFVTPLTPRGTSQNITALLVVNAADGKATINTSPNLPATSSIENTIRSASVAGDPSWATRWASGMKVYEMVPAANGHWAASIGLGQIVNYRADIAPDGTVTVSNTEGSDKPVTPPVVVNPGKPLSEMSKDELVKLIEDAAKELANR